jgi:hypothetical protein
LLRLMLASLVISLLSVGGSAAAAPHKLNWRVAHVTAYATWEGLTGCSGGVCTTACGTALNDNGFTVAVNYRIDSGGVDCGTRVTFCKPWPHWICHNAVINDRTLSGFDFEFSYALARFLGRPRYGWDSPWYPIWTYGWHSKNGV